ncbi:SusD/RagB family nutrient-binding outer membrane lipoprotein, partial [Flavihumibacter sediminis]|nr:SusD/RagB family nutrient-binding outer membrane lipoprotein [Flavihumibacter sediminis]
EKWKRLINSYTLRILMSLSKKENNTALNIKSRFNEIISNPAKYPLMTSNADNGRLPYYDITGNQYPYFNNNSMKTDYYLDVSFITMLQDLKDPRLFVFGKPTPSSNGAVMDFDS